MSDEKKPLEEVLLELTALKNAMEDQVARNQRVYDAAESALGRIAREHYPEMKNWDSEQLRKLADVISRAAQNFWSDLDSIDAQTKAD